jgi:hypothetical protein
LAFEARTYLLCFIDLRRPVDCLGDALPDSRKSPTERGFKLSELVVKRGVTRRDETSDLGDAEKRIGVENEGDEELTGGEFRIVERCPSRVRGFPVTAATLDPVGAVEGMETVCATVWTGAFFPDRLETPLDDGVERRGPKFYYSKFRKFR